MSCKAAMTEDCDRPPVGVVSLTVAGTEVTVRLPACQVHIVTMVKANGRVKLGHAHSLTIEWEVSE